VRTVGISIGGMGGDGGQNGADYEAGSREFEFHCVSFQSLESMNDPAILRTFLYADAHNARLKHLLD
jgi:hypothetical protein